MTYRFPKVNKDYMEKASRKAGLLPVARGEAKDYDIYVADGYCQDPKVKLQKFHPEEKYHDGAYATLWFIADHNDVVMFGACLFGFRRHRFPPKNHA